MKIKSLIVILINIYYKDFINDGSFFIKIGGLILGRVPNVFDD